MAQNKKYTADYPLPWLCLYHKIPPKKEPTRTLQETTLPYNNNIFNLYLQLISDKLNKFTTEVHGQISFDLLIKMQNITNNSD